MDSLAQPVSPDSSTPPPPLPIDSSAPPPLPVDPSPLSLLISRLRRYGSSLITSALRILHWPVSTLFSSIFPNPISFTFVNQRFRFSFQLTRLDGSQLGRVIEVVVPYSILLFLICMRKRLQGLVVPIYITVFMFKSNNILKKQTALKRGRKFSVLVGHFVVSVLHIIGVFWWYRSDGIFSPLVMVPPKSIPSFWRAVLTILINDTVVRQAGMTCKLFVLMCHRKGSGLNFCRQGQLLTITEYALLLYRELLPTPVWYRFFLPKDYGSFFPVLTTMMYFGFKLPSVFERVRSFFSSLKALSHKDMHYASYASYATLDQVNDAGESCAVCQEKMHVPVLLSCKHVFCEDCVTEWFERERSCPLCRAVVRPAEVQSYADGSTGLFVQLC